VFNYLIRVKLPDRPGALGAVASRIGSVGGDVVSIGVGLAGDNLIDLLRDEILEVDGVSIESVRPVEGAVTDRSTDLLDVAGELFRQASPADLFRHLTSRVRRGLAATYAAVVNADTSTISCCDGEPPDPADLCAEVSAELGSASVVGTANGSDTDSTDGLRPDLSLAALNHAGLLLVVGRTHPILRNRERRWISAMAELADYSWRELS
jgi:hypothetical protein